MMRLEPNPTKCALDPTRTGRDAEQLDANLRRLIVGQDAAIEQIVNIFQMHVTGLNAPGRPVGNFLFLGPTGTGKTRIVEAMADSLVGNPRAVIKIDCAEFQHSHEIAKLIGSPPGYLGHRETHPLLSQEMINQHHTDKVKLSFILFDEIEKASDALWNLLLGILDKATLTLGDNRKVDFSRAMIFMTSNLGAAEMANLVTPKLGFGLGKSTSANQSTGSAAAAQLDEKMNDKISRSGVEAARRKFTPEFMNRLDKVVVFKPLGEEQLRQILNIELKLFQQRIFNIGPDKAFVFQCTESAKSHLLEQGTDTKYGARHLKRAIERLLVQPISNLLATEQVLPGDLIRIDFDAEAGKLTFFREGQGMSPYAMSQLADVRFTASLMAASAAIEMESPRPQSARTGRRG